MLPDGHLYIARSEIRMRVSCVYIVHIYQTDKNSMKYFYNFKTTKHIFGLFCSILLKSIFGQNYVTDKTYRNNFLAYCIRV